MYELLCEVVSMCVKITKKTKADCFFGYSAHVDRYDIQVYLHGWNRFMSSEEHSRSYIAFQNDLTKKNLKKSKEQLVEIAKQLGVEV